MQRTSRLGLIGASTAALAISILAVAPVSARPNPELASHVHFMPTRAAAAQAAPHGDAKPGGGGGGGGTQAGIYYHGGRVASTGSAAFRVVSIYWGTGAIYPDGPSAGTTDTNTGGAAQDGSLVGTYLRSLGGTPYYRINRGYWDNLGTSGALRYVSGAVTYDGYWADGTNAPSGTQNVSDQAVIDEIVAGFSSGRLTYHPDTIYAVFSAGGVNLGGGAFSQYCAYHGNFSFTDGSGSHDVIYAVMPYNDFSSSCKAQTTGPNNSPADAEVNTLTHEIEEANTDPDLNAWYDLRGSENADKCAWTFGTTHTATNGALYNVTFGGRNWLIQQQWKNSGRGSCALS